MMRLRQSLHRAALCAVLFGCGAAAPGERPVAPASEALEPERAEVPQASPLVLDGESKLANGEPEAAQALFERAIAEDPEDARAHFDLGMALEAQGDIDAAERAYRRAVELRPDFAEALNNLGVLLRAQGELGEARPLFERAVQANPESASAHLNLALAEEDMGALEQAEAHYRRALDLEPDHHMARANHGLLLIRLGRRDEARTQLQRAGQGAGNDTALLLTIGNGLRQVGDTDGALQAMQAAVDSADERTPALLSELALAQRAAGNKPEAVATLRAVIERHPGYATAHYLIANMLAGDGKYRQARKHYQRYLKLAPEGPHADKARERLAKVRELSR